MPSFADRLKELRKSKGITQKQTAESVGMSERNYIDLEQGKFKPSHDNLLKLADFFDISLDYLTGRSDNPNRQ